MNRSIRTLLLAVSGSIFACNVWAAPLVTSANGTFNDSQTVTISGSGFGSKSPAAPLLWDTFEGGTNGGVVQNINATVGRWDSGAGSDNVFYFNALGYGGSGKSARHPFTMAKWNSSLSKNASSFPVLFLDFKRYYPSSNGAPSNYKPFRMYGDNDTMELYTGYGCGYQVSTIQNNGGTTTDWNVSSLSGKMDSWQHYQLIYKESSVGLSDGTIKNIINGVPDGWNSSNVKTRVRTGSLDQIRIGHYHDVGARDGCDPNDNSVVYTDNVYIDTTWARVEIGNAPTYAASTKREIQIPSAWTNNSITLSVNKGAFTNGQQVYLYVFDSSGVGNISGFPVTIGGGSGSTPPPAPLAAPAGLRIVSQ